MKKPKLMWGWSKQLTDGHPVTLYPRYISGMIRVRITPVPNNTKKP